MRIALLFGPHMHIGSSTASLYLAYHDPDTFIPFSINTIGGKPGVVKSKLEGGVEMYSPVHSISHGLKELNPDGILLFTLNGQLYNSIDKIVKRWPTAWRFNINLLELFIRPNDREMIPHILNMSSKVDAIITPREEIEQDLNRIGWRNTVTIPTCLDTSKFRPSEPDGDVVVSMTRISSIKNFMTSLLAMRTVIQRNPSIRYEIYGAGGLSDYIQKMIKMFGSERIIFKGYGEADEILSRAKVLLQLSLSENQSLSPLEAMASGTPCVVSDIGGHPKKGVCRVPHDSIHKTAEAVERLIDDKKYYNKIRSAGLEEVKKHDIEKNAPKYIELFERLIKLKDNFKEGSG